VSAISRRVRERDIQRQILFNRSMRYVTGRVPVLLPDFLKMLMGSLIGFWVIVTVLSYIPHAKPLYSLPVFGLLFSLQAAYYKYRLSVDPNYEIPKCRCAGRGDDNTETVLKSSQSAILRIPNSVLGAAVYVALLLSVYLGNTGTALSLAVAAVLASAYLSYVMVVKIGGLCVNCINVAALNVLILWQLLR
jgi:uncharacterized membrane protein